LTSFSLQYTLNKIIHCFR